MSPAAQHLVAVVGVVVWVLLALLVAIAIGRSIKQADERARLERERKACCPHSRAAAGDTVRGEFRAIVVPSPRPVERLDVYL